MSLMRLIAISGIFGSKNEDLDLLPPPPPFPDLGIEELSTAPNAKLARGKKGKGKLKRLDAKNKRLKIPESDASFEGMAEPPLPEQKKSFFGKLFGKKDEDLERGLEELEEMPMPKEPKFVTKKLPEIKITKSGIKTQKPKKELPGDIFYSKVPLNIEEGPKPLDIKKDEEEIRESIESIQGKKKHSIDRFFSRKEKEIHEKIETPEVMPRTFDKIDHVQEIEERIHKARLLLMDFRFEDAKRVYVEIMRTYKELEAKDRSKVYDDIMDLYYERKSAEKFAKV